MQKNLFRWAWFSLLAGILLACNFVNGVGEGIRDTRETAQSAATQIDQGLDVLATGRALGTQVAESGLIQTAQAVATRAAESGLDETAQAVATRVAESGLDETAQAYLTEEVPGLLQTAQALATSEGPGLVEGAQDLATRIAGSLGQAPDDIPVVEGEKESYSASDAYVIYLTPLSYTEVLDFYKAEMPDQGWTKVEPGSFEAEGSAILIYQKSGRKAMVSLIANPATQQTVVTITIQPV